jgi:hypothetical protein
VTHVDAVQKIPTKCGAELLQIFWSPHTGQAADLFFDGDFSWDFFSVAKA